MKRRHLIKAGGVGALGMGAVGAAHAEEKQYNWKMVMSWPKNFPGLGTAAQWFADELKRVTNGQINITIYGGGELVPALEVFNAVGDGTAELGHGTGYYWKGTVPEAELFTSVPFGLTPLDYTSWYELNGGHDLHVELYKPFNVMPLLGGNTDYQMGGWFNKEINTLDDFKGLKIRMPGIGGEVLKRVGATPVTIPGSEIFTSMQSGVIEAADWVGPWNDLAFGLYKVAKYYYGGWNEPCAGSEILVNGDVWNSLPEHLRAQIQSVAQAMTLYMVNEYRANNAKALQTLIEKHNVNIRFLSDDIIRELKKITAEYLNEYAAQSDIAKRIADSYRAFSGLQDKGAENQRHILQYRNL